MEAKRYSKGPRWRREPPYEVSVAFDIIVIAALIVAVLTYING